MKTFQKILVPVDFSQRSANGLKYAASLAQETRAELVIMHAFDKREETSFIDSLAALEGWPISATLPHRMPVDRLFREKSLDLYNFIQEVLEEHSQLTIKRRVRMGSTATEIVEVAKQEGVDLVVLALRKKSLFPYLLARGVLLKLNWEFPCPVLLMPQPALHSS